MFPPGPADRRAHRPQFIGAHIRHRHADRPVVAAGVKDAIFGVAHGHPFGCSKAGAKGAKARRQAGPGGFGQRALPGIAGRIAFDIIAGQAAQQLVDWRAQAFALQILQCQVQRAQRMQFFAPRPGQTPPHDMCQLCGEHLEKAIWHSLRLIFHRQLPGLLIGQRTAGFPGGAESLCPQPVAGSRQRLLIFAALQGR
jgi:hypothetical protein